MGLGEASSGVLNAKPTKNAKNAVVTPAQNGLFIQMQKVDEYGCEYVAKTLDEVLPIFNGYFGE